MEKIEEMFQTVDTVSKKMDVKSREVLSRNRSCRLVDARSMIAAVLKQQAHVRQQDIADLFGISQAAVSKLLVRHQNLMQADKGYKRRFEAL